MSSEAYISSLTSKEKLKKKKKLLSVHSEKKVTREAKVSEQMTRREDSSPGVAHAD